MSFNASSVNANPSGVATVSATVWSANAANGGEYSCSPNASPSSGGLGAYFSIPAPGTPITFSNITSQTTGRCDVRATNAAWQTASCSATVTLLPPLPTCTLTLNGSTGTTVMADVNGNASVPFNLTSSYATNGNYSCTGGISPLSGPLGALSGPGTLSFAGVTSQQPHSCTVTSLTGAGGTSTNPCAASVTLVPPASCTISFSPASATIAADGTATATVGWGSSASTASGTYSCTGTIAPISGALVPLSWGPGPMTFSGASPGSATCTITPKNALDQAGIPCSASVTLLPPAPTVVTLTISPATVSPGQLVSATWSGNNSPTSYTLRQTAPPPAATVYQGPATSLQTAAPATAVTYTYTVQACNAAGCSQESPPATLTVINEPPPGTPVWRIKDSLGPILTIDSLGNAFLVPTSQVNFNTAPPAGLTGAFLLKRNAERVFAFSRNVTYLKGSVRPGQTGLTAGSGKLAIKNGSGQIVAVFDGASGNLYLRGAAVGGM